MTYPLAGSAQLNFFGQAVGNNGTTLEETNMPVQGSFGTSSFIVKGIQLKYKLPDSQLVAYNGLDATNLAVEILGGLFTGGVLNFVINAKTYAQLTQPFFQMPPADGRVRRRTAGQVSVDTSGRPDVALPARSEARYIMEPELFIGEQQNFAVSISYPSGAMPVRASSIITADNPLRLGVELDGIEFRPVQ